MGISVYSSKTSCHMGYGGFKRFRTDVAKQVGYEFGVHYSTDLDKGLCLWGTERDNYFDAYDKKTAELVKNGVVSDAVANFCYQTDCEGSIDKAQAKEIYALIKDCDECIIYG